MWLINKACAELPEGWEIQIHLESGYGGIELYDETGLEYEMDMPDMTFAERLEATIEFAKKMDRSSRKV